MAMAQAVAQAIAMAMAQAIAMTMTMATVMAQAMALAMAQAMAMAMAMALAQALAQAIVNNKRGGAHLTHALFFMKKKYDAVATVGKYTKEGIEKKRYLTVGAVFESDDGKLTLKLEGVPVSPDWSGWIAFYEPKLGYTGTTENDPPPF
jgi:hypothetical protein